MESSEDEKLQSAYYRIIQKSTPIDEPDEDADETETEVEVAVFDVESYIYTFQDKINQILGSSGVSLRFTDPKTSKIHRANINRIYFEFGSNCCLMVRIDFDYLFAPSINKKQICRHDINVTLAHTNTCLMKITHAKEIHTHQLIIYEKFMEHEAVAFTIVSDLDLRDLSVWLKIGYLDYIYL